MECFVQFFDDLDDLVAAIGLARERIRTLFLLAGVTVLSISMQVSGILLAISRPQAALLVALLLLTLVICRHAGSGRIAAAGR